MNETKEWNDAQEMLATLRATLEKLEATDIDIVPEWTDALEKAHWNAIIALYALIGVLESTKK